MSAPVSIKKEPLLLISSDEFNVTIGGCLLELKKRIVTLEDQGSAIKFSICEFNCSSSEGFGEQGVSLNSHLIEYFGDFSRYYLVLIYYFQDYSR